MQGRAAYLVDPVRPALAELAVKQLLVLKQVMVLAAALVVSGCAQGSAPCAVAASAAASAEELPAHAASAGLPAEESFENPVVAAFPAGWAAAGACVAEPVAVHRECCRPDHCSVPARRTHPSVLPPAASACLFEVVVLVSPKLSLVP